MFWRRHLECEDAATADHFICPQSNPQVDALEGWSPARSPRAAATAASGGVEEHLSSSFLSQQPQMQCFLKFLWWGRQAGTQVPLI